VEGTGHAPPDRSGERMTDAQRMIDSEVRDLVRQRGIDPAVEMVEVRRLAEAVVAAYEQRSLVSALPPIVDGDAIVQDVTDAVAGFGPLQRYLDDPAVEEIWINEPSRVFIARDGRTELTATILSEAEVRDLVERMLRSSGRRLDLSSPFVDAMLPDGSRLHVAIPDVTREHWAVNVRKHVVRAGDLDDLVGLGTLTVPAADFLRASVAAGLNILVSGGTQAGKTTLLNCLLAAVPARERVITAEEVFELKAPLPDIVALQTRQVGLEGTGQITLRHLVTEALRMRPNRIVVGEVRREEALDLLIALNSGVPGMGTVHANSAREAVTKICTLPLLAGENIGSGFVVPTVAGSIDLVVHVATDQHGRRQVREIVAVPGRVEGHVVALEPVFVHRHGRLARADGFPPHVERFETIGVDVRRLLDEVSEPAA
jgi:pilus assembly protein CpaF